MDIVIAYVNGNDPDWKRSYECAIGGTPSKERFRDWGTLPYLFRGIAKFLPFIRKVHLLVSSESQVPAWVNRKSVNIVLHKDIIPERFLPLFNSSCIELFLHRIPGLDEQFIYFNDDMFVLMPCDAQDFFPSGKPRVWVRTAPVPTLTNVFRMTCKNSSDMAYKIAGLPRPDEFILKPQHSPSPMLTSINKEIFQTGKEKIFESISKLRAARNFNQYLFLDFYWLSGACYKVPQDFTYLELHKGPKPICETILSHSNKLCCINDKGCTDFLAAQQQIISAFHQLLPDKSHFEL
jgi:hypothetical protein